MGDKVHWRDVSIVRTADLGAVFDEKERVRILRLFSNCGYAQGHWVTVNGKSARVVDISWEGFPWR